MTKGKIVQVMGPVVDVEFTLSLIHIQMCIRDRSEASRQIEQADVLLLLGTSIGSEVYSKYLNYFEGRYLILIHKERQFLDERADLLILEEPRKVLEKLKFQKIQIVSQNRQRKDDLLDN